VAAYRRGFDLLWRATADEAHSPENLVPGVLELIQALAKRNVEVFVVTGGDLAHKLGILRRVGICPGIPEANVFGDGGAGFEDGFTKALALRRIDAQLRTRWSVPQEASLVAVVGDGRRDMEAAREAGALAVGFNQPRLADVVVSGDGFPADALVELLLDHEGHG
jgi:phosphoglycolate phosphatase-like HAD superfamily hydrolase